MRSMRFMNIEIGVDWDEMMHGICYHYVVINCMIKRCSMNAIGWFVVCAQSFGCMHEMMF